MGGGSGVRAGYAYELPVLNGPYARELLKKQEERGLFQMEIPGFTPSAQILQKFTF